MLTIVYVPTSDSNWFAVRIERDLGEVLDEIGLMDMKRINWTAAMNNLLIRREDCA